MIESTLNGWAEARGEDQQTLKRALVHPAQPNAPTASVERLMGIVGGEQTAGTALGGSREGVSKQVRWRREAGL